MLLDMKRLLLVLLLLAVPCAVASGAPTEPQPIFRIETGHHTQAVRRVSIDAAGKWLLTASADRTARLWSLANGKLVATYRAPLGVGEDGSIYSAAISPDAKTVVLSALASVDVLFVIDRATGKLLQRVTDLPSAGLGLFFSRDGKRLAVTFQSGGVAVYDTATWTVSFQDASYQGPVYGADFDGTGRLVTVCHDGLIRLYSRDGQPLSSVSSNAGHFPQSVRFSPDGERVLAGFLDGASVAVLSGKDLAPLFSPPSNGITFGDLHAVSWVGAHEIAATGSANVARWWNVDIAPETKDAVRSGHGVILDAVGLPDGSLAYGASDGSWGVLARKGGLKRQDLPVTVSFEGARVKILRDAKSVRFAYEPPQKKLGAFSVADLKLTPNSERWEDWFPASLTDRHFEVTNWQNQTKPKLNGRRLTAINKEETTHSLAIASDGSYFVLGSDWHLFSFAPNGTVRWSGTVPGSVDALNIGDDNRLIVAAYADGTIRWQRASDGAPLLEFFPLSDRKRWIAVTPSGYYATSPGAENLVGFVLNEGTDKLPTFAPAAKFQARFHRPDVVKRVLDTLDEDEAVRRADQARVANH
jgi:WD40 repeat protein